MLLLSLVIAVSIRHTRHGPQARLRRTLFAPLPNPSTTVVRPLPPLHTQINPYTLQQSVTGGCVQSIPSAHATRYVVRFCESKSTCTFPYSNTPTMQWYSQKSESTNLPTPTRTCCSCRIVVCSRVSPSRAAQKEPTAVEAEEEVATLQEWR